MDHPSRFSPSRRRLLQSGAAVAAGLAMPYVITSAARAASKTMTIADVGGAVSPAIRKAFYDPFTKETGIDIVNVAGGESLVTQIKLLVDSKSYIWDVAMITPDHVHQLTEKKHYLADLDLGLKQDDFVPGTLKPNWLGFSVFGIAMAYRTDVFKNGGPQSWADYWDVEKFPGHRGFYRSPWGTLDLALLADGVPLDKLYPLDVDRAFKKLDEIRKHIDVWWTSGAQNTQILQSGEVDLCDTWSARAAAAKDSGTPLEMLWHGLYSTDGWGIPAGNPKLEMAREFVKFVSEPKNQAAYSSLVANGPSAKKAYDYITPERAKVLPTAPANAKTMGHLDEDYWGANHVKLAERFNEWLLAG